MCSSVVYNRFKQRIQELLGWKDDSTNEYIIIVRNSQLNRGLPPPTLLETSLKRTFQEGFDEIYPNFDLVVNKGVFKIASKQIVDKSKTCDCALRNIRVSLNILIGSEEVRIVTINFSGSRRRRIIIDIVITIKAEYINTPLTSVIVNWVLWKKKAIRLKSVYRIRVYNHESLNRRIPVTTSEEVTPIIAPVDPKQFVTRMVNMIAETISKPPVQRKPLVLPYPPIRDRKSFNRKTNNRVTNIPNSRKTMKATTSTDCGYHADNDSDNDSSESS